MKFTRYFLVLVAALIGLAFYTKHKARLETFVDLFNGENLHGWRGDPELWRVENHTIIGEIKPGKELKRNSFLIWDQGAVRDFELIAEYRISAKGNSGFNYRSEELADLPYALKGYQADLDGSKKYTGQNYEERGRTIIAFPGQKVRLPPVSGDLANHVRKNAWTATEKLADLGNADELKQAIKSNDWNELRIVAKGNRLQHYINNVLMSDVTDDDPAHRKMEGLLGLQVHVGPPMTMEVRRIRLKKL
ncbi:MAG: DUF1080 domain-containing protein [Luteolibacter sp.]